MDYFDTFGNRILHFYESKENNLCCENKHL